MAAGVPGRTAVPEKTGSPGGTNSGTTGPIPAPRVPRTTTVTGHAARKSPALAAVRGVLTRAWWNTPRLVRAITALCLAALLTTAAVAATVLSGARDSVDTIGHQAAPQAVRAADLYFALSDMDAQAANLLLVGADPDYNAQRKQTQDTYEQRRAQADTDLQGAAEAAAADPAGQRAVRAVLGELGDYEALIARARLLEDQAHAPAGKPSTEALDTYRQATDLLRRQLLPAADQVTATNAATVERIYATQRDDLAAGRWWLLAAGVLALSCLAALQYILSLRFRRTVNVPLAATTLITVVTLAAGLSLVSGGDRHLVEAKSNAYDSVIALSRARAVAYDLNADESRYLTDPALAAAYEQSFFDKTQSIARVDGATLATYDSELAAMADLHRADHRTVPFDGYLGTELRNITFTGEQDAAERILTAFQKYQQDDRKIRDLRDHGNLKEAVTFDTGTSAGQSNADFDQLTQAFAEVLTINQRAFDQEVSHADADLGASTAGVGAAVLAAALALTVLGVRPRLREYR